MQTAIHKKEEEKTSSSIVNMSLLTTACNMRMKNLIREEVEKQMDSFLKDKLDKLVKEVVHDVVKDVIEKRFKDHGLQDWIHVHDEFAAIHL
jgi:hypothetical protein